MEERRPTQSEYDNMDVSTLTEIDALEDLNFGKTQFDVMKFCAVDDAIMRTIPEFTDDELITFMRALANFYNAGAFPDYKTITSTAARMALRACIDAHMERMNKTLRESYKSFVKGKKSKKK